MKHLKNYLIMINEEYCDAQAIVTQPDGEMGGDHYVELHSTYPICIGNYRSKSRAEAVREGAKEFGCNEEILYAIPVSK